MEKVLMLINLVSCFGVLFFLWTIKICVVQLTDAVEDLRYKTTNISMNTNDARQKTKSLRDKVVILIENQQKIQQALKNKNEHKP